MLLTPRTLCELCGMRHRSNCRGRTTSHCCYCDCYWSKFEVATTSKHMICSVITKANSPEYVKQNYQQLQHAR